MYDSVLYRVEVCGQLLPPMLSTERALVFFTQNQWTSRCSDDTFPSVRVEYPILFLGMIFSDRHCEGNLWVNEREISRESSRMTYTHTHMCVQIEVSELVVTSISWDVRTSVAFSVISRGDDDDTRVSIRYHDDVCQRPYKLVGDIETREDESINRWKSVRFLFAFMRQLFARYITSRQDGLLAKMRSRRKQCFDGDLEFQKRKIVICSPGLFNRIENPW